MSSGDLLAALADPHGVIDARSVAVIAAHPDDEVIGAGGQLARLLGVAVVHVTDGAPRNRRDALAAGLSTRHAYADLRRQEAIAALALAGVSPDRLFAFGIVDQEASLQLVPMAVRVASFIEDHAIDSVLTHAYEGGHPDHDATAFAVHAAVSLIARSRGAAPAIIEMSGYHAGPQGLATSTFLPGDTVDLTLRLGTSQREAKRRMLACYRTQAATLAPFAVDIERFRAAPAYDFAQPPHPGPLWYEQFDWGLSGEQWRALAAAALRELDLHNLEHSA